MVLREFLHKLSQKFWTGDREVLKEFLHKLLILYHPTTQRLPGPAYRPLRPHRARNPHPLNIENSRRVSYILQSYFAEQSISQPAV